MSFQPQAAIDAALFAARLSVEEKGWVLQGLAGYRDGVIAGVVTLPSEASGRPAFALAGAVIAQLAPDAVSMVVGEPVRVQEDGEGEIAELWNAPDDPEALDAILVYVAAAGYQMFGVQRYALADDGSPMFESPRSGLASTPLGADPFPIVEGTLRAAASTPNLGVAKLLGLALGDVGFSVVLVEEE